MTRAFRFVWIAFVLLLWTVAAAMAYTGVDPSPAMSCAFTNTSVSLGSGGTHVYKLVGSCTGATGAFVAQGAWSPGSGKAQEVITNGEWRMTTTASCRVDPWTTGAPCENSQYWIVDPNNPNLAQPPELASLNAPVSAHIYGVPRGELQAKLSSAVPPPPPPAPDLPPRQVTATETFGGRAAVTWSAAADQTSTHRTVDWYEVQRKPVEDPNWFAVRRLAAGATRLEDPDPIQTPTQYRVCAGNAGGMKCSDPVQPQFASVLKREMQPGGIAVLADKALEDQIIDQLKRDLPALQPRIQVSASAGVVTLAGTVVNFSDKTTVEKVVKGVQGVKGVQNNLQVETLRSAPLERTLKR